MKLGKENVIIDCNNGRRIFNMRFQEQEFWIMYVFELLISNKRSKYS